MPLPVTDSDIRIAMMNNRPSLVALLLIVSSLAWSVDQGPRTVLNVAYRPAAENDPVYARCRVDFYLPAGNNFATFVWFHGGGLEKGERNDEFTSDLAKAYANQGIAVAAVSYRLSPVATFPSYVDDAAASFAYVYKHISDYGGNPKAVFIGGHSAGGYLTYMVTLDTSYLKAYGLTQDAIAGAIPVSGQTITHKTVRKERSLEKFGVLVDEASPLHFLRKDTPPMLVLAAEKDLPARVEENRLLVAIEQEMGNNVVSYFYATDRDHGSIAKNMKNADDPAAQAVVEFIRRIAAQRQ